VDGIVEEYRDIFSSPTGVLTHCQVKHLIDLTLGEPLPNGPVYRHSLLENDEIRRHIQELIQKGHIKPNSSPCRIPIVLVQKKDGTWRLCIDYRSLNKIEPTDVWKTTSKSTEGLFEWLVMPFGLTNAPPTFMRLMDDVLRPFTNSFVVVYLDEILMFNKTWEEHMWHIQ
jgi:hypothetical protein